MTTAFSWQVDCLTPSVPPWKCPSRFFLSAAASTSTLREQAPL